MSLSHARARRAAVCLGAAAATLIATAGTLDARDKPVAIGEIGAKVTRSDIDLAAVLRAHVERELSGLDLSRAPRGAHYVLSASVVRLEAETLGGVAQASCVVSAVLREARGGAIRAVLEGRAKAQNDPKQRAAAELGALAAAVHGAIGGVPEAIR